MVVLLFTEVARKEAFTGAKTVFTKDQRVCLHHDNGNVVKANRKRE
jgi:hypothetical protein